MRSPLRKHPMLSNLHTMSCIAGMRAAEQPQRLLYLAATLAVCTLAWVVLSAFSSPFLASRVGTAVNAELAVANAQTQNGSFPLRHALRMEEMPGVSAVSYFGLASLPCGDGRSSLSINAYGGSGVDTLLRARGASQEVLDRWRSTRNGLLVGADAAARCNLAPGMSLSPRDHLSGVDVPVTIVAILPGGHGVLDDRIAYGHYDYLNRLMPDERSDQVLRARVVGENAATLGALAQSIDLAFASSDPPLQANPASGTESALGRFGQVQALLGLIMAAMATCALLVWVTVLAHLVTQRRPTMAVLQSMGFGRGLQFGALALEVAAVITGGAVLGVLGGHGAIALLNPRVSWLLGPLRVPDWAFASLLPALLLLAAIALVWPALQVRRLRPIDHLLT